MELKLLQSFVVLSEELHFGRAAERLCIVQPTLSMQLKALEDELGVQLFKRDRHKVELSATGKIFLPEAIATLSQARRAIHTVQSAGKGKIGQIRIGFVSSLLPFYLPELIRELHNNFPLIELELKDMPTTFQMSALSENKIDFGFVRLPIESGKISTQLLFDEPFVVVMSKQHPLSVQEYIEPRDLADIPSYILARRFAPGFYDEFLLALSRAGLTLKILQELGEFTTMIALVAAGMGIGIVPKLAMSAKPDNIEVRELHLSDQKSKVGLAWHNLESPIRKNFYKVATNLPSFGAGNPGK